MTSFFDKLTAKLNGGKVADGNGNGAKGKKGGGESDDLLARERLEVDLFQSPTEVLIFALAAGVDPNDFDLTLDEENDVIVIEGKRVRPPTPVKKQADGTVESEGKFLAQECSWEPFYRKVTLPAEVDPVKTEAVFKKGVLMIRLPVLNISGGRKLKVVEVLAAGSSDAPSTS